MEISGNLEQCAGFYMKDTGLCRRRGCENLRKPLIIVATVSGYSLLEIGLLLSSIVSHQGYFYPSTYQAVVYLAQILLIPGLAAVFSRIIYGSHEWIRRTVMMLLGAALLGPAAIIVVFAPAVVLAWAFDVSRVLFDLLLPLTLGGMAVGLFLTVRKSGKWAVRAEAARWLAERQSRVDPRVRRWRSRSICAVLWIPLTMVLVVFLISAGSVGNPLAFHSAALVNLGRLPGFDSSHLDLSELPK